MRATQRRHRSHRRHHTRRKRNASSHARASACKAQRTFWNVAASGCSSCASPVSSLWYLLGSRRSTQGAWAWCGRRGGSQRRWTSSAGQRDKRRPAWREAAPNVGPKLRGPDPRGAGRAAERVRDAIELDPACGQRRDSELGCEPERAQVRVRLLEPQPEHERHGAHPCRREEEGTKEGGAAHAGKSPGRGEDGMNPCAAGGVQKAQPATWPPAVRTPAAQMRRSRADTGSTGAPQPRALS